MKNTWAEMLRAAGWEEEGQKVTDTKKMRGIRQETRLRSGYKEKNDRRKGRRDRDNEKTGREGSNWKLRRQVRGDKKETNHKTRICNSSPGPAILTELTSPSHEAGATTPELPRARGSACNPDPPACL